MAQLKQTVSVTNASQTVTAAGDLSAQIKANNIFMVQGLSVPYTVAANSTYSAATGLTTFTLTGAYQGTTDPAAAGVIVTDFTSPDLIPMLRQNDVGTASIFTQAMLKIQTLLSQALKHPIFVGQGSIATLPTVLTEWTSAEFTPGGPNAKMDVFVAAVTSGGAHNLWMSVRIIDKVTGLVVADSGEVGFTCQTPGIYVTAGRSIATSALVAGKTYRVALTLRADAANTITTSNHEISGLYS